MLNKNQSGYTIIEAMIALTVSTIAMVYMIWPNYVESRRGKAANQATQLVTVSNAVATYMTKNYGSLVSGTPIAGVANLFAPTVPELRSQGLLLPNFAPTNMYGGAYAVLISKQPVGCVAPDCDISSITVLTTPITNPMTGRVDGGSLGTAASALGEDGGFSTTVAPGSITGAGGSWSMTNPLGSVAGILGMRAGYGSSGLAQFMRRDGQLPATGAQDMGGQDVNFVNTMRSTAITNSGSATVGGALAVSGQTTTTGITNNGALQTGNTNITGPAAVSGTLQAGATTINGQATINGGATITGAVTVGSSLAVSGGTTLNTLAVSGQTTTNGVTNNGRITNTGDIQTGRLYLTTIITNGASCAGYTGYQAATAAGSIASCINGTWQTPAASIPPPSPCNSTTVSFQGCTGTVPYTLSGNTASVAVTSGSGSATYSCNNGSWAFMSGNCTPPPAGCPAQTVSWGSCSASTSSLSHGAGRYVNDTAGTSTGSAYAYCSNGVISTSSTSCATTPATTSYSNPKSTEGISLAANPSLRSAYCSNRGKIVASGATEADYGGLNMPVCWSIDGFGYCTGSGNCSTMAAGNPGCYVQTKIVCQ